jgi:plastocyanin
VAKGTEVRFINDDTAPHTVTADADGTDSGTLGPGTTFPFVVQEPFSYHCAIHPSMTAEIRLNG